MKILKGNNPINNHKLTLTLEDYVPYQLALLSNRLSQTLEIVCMRECGISRQDWRVLALVAGSEGCTARDLTDRRVMDAVAVHRAVRRLEEEALIVADVAVTDRRKRILRLTDSGRRAYETIVPHALELENQLLGILSPGEERQLRQALTKMLAHPLDTFPDG